MLAFNLNVNNILDIVYIHYFIFLRVSLGKFQNTCTLGLNSDTKNDTESPLNEGTVQFLSAGEPCGKEEIKSRCSRAGYNIHVLDSFKCLMFSDTWDTWSGADASCRAEGGTLFHPGPSGDILEYIEICNLARYPYRWTANLKSDTNCTRLRCETCMTGCYDDTLEWICIYQPIGQITELRRSVLTPSRFEGQKEYKLGENIKITCEGILKENENLEIYMIRGHNETSFPGERHNLFENTIQNYNFAQGFFKKGGNKEDIDDKCYRYQNLQIKIQVGENLDGIEIGCRAGDKKRTADSRPKHTEVCEASYTDFEDVTTPSLFINAEDTEATVEFIGVGKPCTKKVIENRCSREGYTIRVLDSMKCLMFGQTLETWYAAKASCGALGGILFGPMNNSDYAHYNEICNQIESDFPTFMWIANINDDDDKCHCFRCGECRHCPCDMKLKYICISQPDIGEITIINRFFLEPWNGHKDQKYEIGENLTITCEAILKEDETLEIYMTRGQNKDFFPTGSDKILENTIVEFNVAEGYFSKEEQEGEKDDNCYRHQHLEVKIRVEGDLGEVEFECKAGDQIRRVQLLTAKASTIEQVREVALLSLPWCLCVVIIVACLFRRKLVYQVSGESENEGSKINTIKERRSTKMPSMSMSFEFIQMMANDDRINFDQNELTTESPTNQTHKAVNSPVPESSLNSLVLERPGQSSSTTII